MIDLSQKELATLLLLAAALGAVLGVLYDCLRAIREIFASRGAGGCRRALSYAVTFLTDLVFWLTVGVSSVILLYGFCGGVFRGMVYLGIGAGFLLYSVSLGRAVRALLLLGIRLLKRGIGMLLRLLAIPLCAARRGIISLYHLTIGRFLGKIKRMMKKAREARLVKEPEGAEEIGTGEDRRGGEDFVYVGERAGYARDGRIRFG
jgi:hypothetical protein